MNRSSLPSDEEQDSLFGSPPPSPVRGRSPSEETSVAGKVISPRVALPGTGAGRKNVGTIALPGSHMSCAELPANLLASSSSLPRRTSSHNLLSIPPRSISETPPSAHTPVVVSRSSTRSVPTRGSPMVSTVLSASAPTRRRRTPKSKSLTPAPTAPPIALPGPNEPTPSNFLRSQSSLLGLAGVIGSVKPAQLHTQSPQPSSVQPSRSRSPIHGSTPTHPIVLDDDDDTPRIRKQPHGEFQMPQRLDQLDPETLRSNIMNSLAKEKNIFPVLESLIKLFGGEPHLPPANPPPQPFTRPYGHGVFSTQSPSSSSSSSTLGTSTSSVAPPPKRRKLKHVPAGAVDWDIPFPFAVGEGPEAYRDRWAQDRGKQLVSQLLELVQNAAKRAAIKTAKNGRNGRNKVQRSASAESDLPPSVGSAQANVQESLLNADSSPEDTAAEVASNIMPMDSQNYPVGPSESPGATGSSASGFKDRISVDSEGAVEEAGSTVPCDYSAFEEWLSQLEQFVPFETSAPMVEPDWGTRTSASLDSSSSPASDTSVSSDALTTQAVLDEAIDPALLAISQRAGPTRSSSPTCAASTLAQGDTPQVLDISPASPVLTHSPRTSLSSLTEPLTPPSEAFADISARTMAHQDLVRGLFALQPVEKDHLSRPENQGQAGVSSPSPTERSGSPQTTAARKGKIRADDGIGFTTPSASNRSTPGATCMSKGALDKQAILERAREHRKQLVAEIEEAKMEIWKMSIENAVLVKLTKDRTP